MTPDPGKCIICSAPSGAGKTTLVRHLLAMVPELAFSVSATSRPRRSNEVDGVDYHFLSPEDFRARIASGEFVEWEEVYPGRFYGTLRSEVERMWSTGRHIVFDVDVVGGMNLKRRFAHQALSVFIQPPSLQVLAERLVQRGTETPDTLRVRLDKASEELQAARHFDVVVVNDDLDRACREAEVLVRSFLAR